MQVWCPLRGPAQDSPLAVCDAATADQKDLLNTAIHFPDRVGEVYNVMHSPKHRYTCLPVYVQSLCFELC